MIVFGHNSFSLNKCKPSQLGLPSDLDQQFTIERRQRYAHLFWIPVFGIGKIWGLRKKEDGKLYQPSLELAVILETLPLKEKTPWYTYSFFILGLVGSLLTFLYMQVEQYQSMKRREAYRAEVNQKITNAIHSPLPYHYYDMEGTEGHLYLKVIDSDQQSILFQKTYRGQGQYSYDNDKMLKAFADSSKAQLDTVRVLKKDMLNTVNREDSYSFQGYALFKSDELLKLNQLKEYPFPVFESLSYSYGEGEFYAVIRNIGAEAQFSKLDTHYSNLILADKSFPDKLSSGEYLFLEGEYTDDQPNFEGILKLQNSIQDTIPYEMRMYGSYIFIKQLSDD